MGKRQPKPEPFSIAELEEIAQSPALQGFEKVLQYRPVLLSPPSTVEDYIASTVEDTSDSTVEVNPTTTVVAYPSSTVEDLPSSTVLPAVPGPLQLEPVQHSEQLWIAEGAGGVFTSSRIKRIHQAQDALTHVEEAVYDALWGPKKKDSEQFRLSQMGYSELAKRSRVSKRSIQSVIERLIDKLFIQVAVPADIANRRSTVYRVLGYSAVLAALRTAGHRYVVRTGRGVFFARSVQVASTTLTVEDRPTSTVEVPFPSTVEVGVATPVVPRSPSTVEASATGTSLDKKPVDTTSSSVSYVASRIIKLMAVDDDAVRLLIRKCRDCDHHASDDEIAYCAELWLGQNGRNTSIRKPAAVMLTAVPKFFEPPATELTRYRTQKANEAQQTKELARRILDDPEATITEREWAQAALSD